MQSIFEKAKNHKWLINRRAIFTIVTVGILMYYLAASESEAITMMNYCASPPLSTYWLLINKPTLNIPVLTVIINTPIYGFMEYANLSKPERKKLP